MLLWTFILRWLALRIVPSSVGAKNKLVFANAGSLLFIICVYVSVAISDDRMIFLPYFIIPIAAACQALWYWKDVSKLAPEQQVATKVDESKSEGLFKGLIRPLAMNPDSAAMRDNEALRNDVADRWNALVRYDEEISTAAEQLRPFGDVWISKLGQAYFALNEDRKYLPNIVVRLKEEAEREKVESWANRFRYTSSGELCTEQSLKIIREAEASGYTLDVQENKVVTASKKGGGTSYLRSNSDIQQFGQYMLRQRPSKENL